MHDVKENHNFKSRLGSDVEADPMLEPVPQTKKLGFYGDAGLENAVITVTEVPQSKIFAPPDGGWGWFVVLGCFLMNLIVNGTSYSFGVIFMELLANYERTSADIAWVYSLNCVTCSWLGPFATALSNIFSFRSVVVVGGFIYSVGIVASSFVTKLEQLYITYGLISGIGSALVYGPSIIMVGRYFDKRRALANGLSAAGSGVGSFLLPPTLHFLCDQYTIKGCILILGAFSFHLCLAGLFYRPVPMKRLQKQREPVFCDLLHEQPIEKDHIRITLHPVGSVGKSLATVPSHHSIREELFETALYPTRGAGGPLVLGSSLLSIPENVVTVEQVPTARFRHLSGASVSKQFRKWALWLYAWPRNLKSGIDSGSLFDFSLLKSRLFLMFTTAVMLASFGYLSVYLILPAHAQDLNISKAEAVSLISIMGACDLTGRITFGWFSDFHLIPRRWGYCGMIFLSAVGTLWVIFVRGYIQLAVFAGWFGFFGGSFMVLNAVLTADLFGLDKLPSAIGLLITIQGIAFLVGPPLVGMLKDQQGDFFLAFFVIAVVMTLGACLLVLESVIAHVLRKPRRPSGTSDKSDQTMTSDIIS
ncbi:monocarboxylate transporter 12-like [Paramacrobiotus metropolitanus]|uniref:monocarboxylate transporter 12-like n=1 Tax=Paramacrobiotus metropolitanus TaxID=2943436 RepID=UPI002445F882|nr:monocarboxylate transporter 12-like [Paramacrobiotus metropolitanus]